MIRGNLSARAHSDGFRIDLTWECGTGTVDVIILRRESFFPTIDDVGTEIEIYRGCDTGAFSDTGITSEKMYYYAMLRLGSNELSTAQAMASTYYGIAEKLFRFLPAIYQRMDASAENSSGQLKRFLEIFGSQYDYVRSFTSAMRMFSDPQQIEGTLLPLLAGWIGWKTDFTRNLAQQRNDLRSAPSLFKTAGTAANLRATINRLNTWNAHIKEFIHSIAISNEPERLGVYQVYENSKPRLVSRQFSFDGHPAMCRDEAGRLWVFYHARQTIPAARPIKTAGSVASANTSMVNRWRIYIKRRCRKEWLESIDLEDNGNDCRYPCVVSRPNGGFQVYYVKSNIDQAGAPTMINQCALAIGTDPVPAFITGTSQASVCLNEGDCITVTVDGKPPRTVVFHQGDVPEFSNCPIQMISDFLDKEIPGVSSSITDEGALCLTTVSTGSQSSLHVAASPLATLLGLTTVSTVFGEDGTAAMLTGKSPSGGVFTNLTEGDTLRIHCDRHSVIEFPLPADPSSDQVCEIINRIFPRMAFTAEPGGNIVLQSPTTGNGSRLQIDVVPKSTAAAALGFGVPIPEDETDAEYTEPSVVVDNNKNIWLFWASCISNQWSIKFRTLTNGTWSSPFTCNTGTQPAREPSALYNSISNQIIVFWSTFGQNSQWDIKQASTSASGASTPDLIVWNYVDPLPPVSTYSRREPAALLLADSSVAVYYSSNHIDGWNIWTIIPGAPSQLGSERQITQGQYSHRGPAVFLEESKPLVMCRSNASVQHSSTLFPGVETIDSRFSGTTSVDLDNAAKTGSLKSLEDSSHYTYDTGTRNRNWYACNTVGVYLIPDADSESLITRSREIIASVLKSFLPIQVRPVFVINPAPVKDCIYTYDDPTAQQPRVIGENISDLLVTSGETELPAAIDGYLDSVPEWEWIRTRSQSFTNHKTVDTTRVPVDTHLRTRHIGIDAGGS
jgi:phage tail-like protein